MRHGISWTDDEKAKLKKAYALHRKSGKTQERALFYAQVDVLAEDRRRNTKNTSSKLLRDIGVPPDKPRAVIEKMVKAKKTAAKPTPKTVPVPDQPELPTLESALSTLISVIAHEVVGAVGLQLMATVKDSGEKATAQMLSEFRKKMAALKVPTPSAPLAREPERAVQNITVNTREPLPENVTKVVVAPKDRKPKVVIFGLIRQQEYEIRAEFGTICDLSFVQSVDVDRDSLRTKDLAFVMTKFSKHNAENLCKSVGLPFYRITGAVSHLRIEMRKWINGEVALTETV